MAIYNTSQGVPGHIIMYLWLLITPHKVPPAIYITSHGIPDHNTRGPWPLIAPNKLPQATLLPHKMFLAIS